MALQKFDKSSVTKELYFVTHKIRRRQPVIDFQVNYLGEANLFLKAMKKVKKNNRYSYFAAHQVKFKIYSAEEYYDRTFSAKSKLELIKPVRAEDNFSSPASNGG